MFARNKRTAKREMDMLHGPLNIPFNILRSMGHSMFPLFSTVLCVCGLRVVWTCSVFRWVPTIVVLYMAWPVTKGAASVTVIAYYLWVRRKKK